MPHVPPVRATKQPTNPGRDCFVRSPSPVVHGPTSPWISLPVSFHPEVTPPYSPLLIVFDGSPLHRTTRTPLRERDCRADDISGFPNTRHPCGHRLGPGSPIHLPGVASLLFGSGNHGQSLFQISPSDERPGGAGKPGTGRHGTLRHSRQPRFMEPSFSLG